VIANDIQFIGQRGDAGGEFGGGNDRAPVAAEESPEFDNMPF
jgi:hypothetical protein